LGIQAISSVGGRGVGLAKREVIRNVKVKVRYYQEANSSKDAID
jgi:hypothetical protein